ncbi:uncharacterized protein LOC111329994 [Stylophora pistillata]|uniref:uncharacterized protein LOC111329994 n=1 Tax=Stylophora pistillata TaxID=50429 RepID=UPI000C046824|nr:uncharacterized protein LOC111329994 [Stylophora pistillata]
MLCQPIIFTNLGFIPIITSTTSIASIQIQYKENDNTMMPEETSIYVDLKYVSNSSQKSLNHKWHVHVNPEGGDTYAAMGERCKSLGGHYNPYEVDLKGTYKSTCFSSNMLRCEVGDLSGKHAMLNVGTGKSFYTDPDLPLFGEMSVIGRGVVVHAENAGAARLACASITPVPSLYIEKTLKYVKGATFSKVTFTKTISAALKIPSWRLFYIRTEGSEVQDCVTVKFGIIGNVSDGLTPTTSGTPINGMKIFLMLGLILLAAHANLRA